MKKIALLAMALVVSIGLVGCGSSDETKQDDIKEVEVHTEKTQEERIENLEEKLDEKVESGDITEEQKAEKLEKVQNGDMQKNKEKQKEKVVEVTTQKEEIQEEKLAEVTAQKEEIQEVTSQIEEVQEEKAYEVTTQKGEQTPERKRGDIQKITQILDKKVQEGSITSEDKDQILKDIQNGDMSKAKEILGGRRQ